VPLVVPVLAAILAITLHASNIFLLIPAIWLTGSAARRPGSRMEALGTVATAAVCLVAAVLVLERVSGSPGVWDFLAGSAGRAFTSLSQSGPGAAALLALNALFIAGPAALLAIVTAAAGGGKKAENAPEMPLLTVTAASALLLILLAAPKLQGGLRWDLVVPASLAMSVYAAAALRRRLSGDGTFHGAAALIVCLGLFHLAGVVMTSSSPAAGERRILDLPLPAGKAEAIIGASAWHGRDFESAERWWVEASGKDPENAAIWYRLGSARIRLENTLDAVNSFHRASTLEPDNHAYRTALAEAYIEQRWFDEAASEFETLVEVFPDSARLWTRLGYAFNHGNRYEEAMGAYERALSFDPGNSEYVRNLTSAVLNRGAELQKDGDYDGAREMYRYARILFPQDWVSLNNLATLEMEMENWEKAYRILSAALKENLGISQLHFNMSVVLENLGDYEEAVRHLQEAARLDPFNPPAAEHIDRLMRKAGLMQAGPE
jgi:tetratricopeptide (TPR) repeat protein